MISADLIYDKLYNSLPVAERELFIRMLVVSDDCGVVPADIDELSLLVAIPKTNLQKMIDSIVSIGLMVSSQYRTKKFLCFKPESFDRYQHWFIHKRTRSEYLHISFQEFTDLSRNFPEFPGISGLRARVKDKGISNKDSSSLVLSSSSNGHANNVEEVIEFCKQIDLSKSDAEYCWHHWEGNGWTNAGKPIRNWRATIRSWKAAGHIGKPKEDPLHPKLCL